MGSDRRLFMAVALDDETRHALASFVSAPGAPAIPGRRVPPPNWHLTLRFLGRSSTVQQEMLLAHLDQALERRPFTVRFGGLGAFPYPQKATVVWLSIAHGGEELEGLAVGCERAAVAAGYDPEERPYHPHLSLARVRPAQDLSDLIAQYPPFPGRLRVDSLVLYESVTGSSGARYSELERISLEG